MSTNTVQYSLCILLVCAILILSTHTMSLLCSVLPRVVCQRGIVQISANRTGLYVHLNDGSKLLSCVTKQTGSTPRRLCQISRQITSKKCILWNRLNSRKHAWPWIKLHNVRFSSTNTTKGLPSNVTNNVIPRASDVKRLLSLAKPERFRLAGM